MSASKPSMPNERQLAGEYNASGTWQRLWHGLALLSQSVMMKCHRLTHISLDFFPCAASRNTSVEIRGIGGKASLRWLDDDQVFFHCLLPVLLSHSPSD